MNSSQHLGTLKQARLVDARRDGVHVRYRLAADDVVVIDVRPEFEYRAGHIPGARSIPVDQLAARLAELPPDRVVVAYCRGPYCVMSYDAVALLNAHGRRGVRLAEGLPDWRAAGHAVHAVHAVHAAPDRA